MLKLLSILGLAGVLLMVWAVPPAAAATEPPVIDFAQLPEEIRTNIDTFLAAGSAEEGEQVQVNGVPTTLRGRDFAVPVRLRPGSNEIEVLILGPSGQRELRKSVVLDSSLDTTRSRLVYVDLEAGNLAGTVVIDLTQESLLGFLPGRHVRGISPNGREAYFADRSVLSTATHRTLRPLGFGKPIPYNGFVVAPDGSRLYSRNQVLDTATRRVVRQFSDNLQTGSSWSGAAIPGGPAISPDGHRIFFGTALRILDTRSFTRRRTNIHGHFLSDLAVTPDGRYLLLSEYSFASGRLHVYDADTRIAVTTVTGLGDFAGEIAFSQDGSKVILGSSGNPASSSDGRLTILDANTFEKLSQTPVQMANNLALSDFDEVLVATGNRAGLDVFKLEGNGNLTLEKTFFLGVHRFVPSSGQPRWDNVRAVVYKPAS